MQGEVINQLFIDPQPIPVSSVSIDGNIERSPCAYVLLLDLSLIDERDPLDMTERRADALRTSSSGVKSLTMLKSLRISSGVLPLIMFATVLQPTSLVARTSISARHLITPEDTK